MQPWSRMTTALRSDLLRANVVRFGAMPLSDIVVKRAGLLVRADLLRQQRQLGVRLGKARDRWRPHLRPNP
jgi:hypothetical protein